MLWSDGWVAERAFGRSYEMSWDSRWDLDLDLKDSGSDYEHLEEGIHSECNRR